MGLREPCHCHAPNQRHKEERNDPLTPQGLCRMRKPSICSSTQAVCLWMHECDRTFSDRLVSDIDVSKYRMLQVNISKKFFDGYPQVCCFICPSATQPRRVCCQGIPTECHLIHQHAQLMWLLLGLDLQEACTLVLNVSLCSQNRQGNKHKEFSLLHLWNRVLMIQSTA